MSPAEFRQEWIARQSELFTQIHSYPQVMSLPRTPSRLYEQDEHSIKDIMKSQGIADFRTPPPIPKFIDTTEALDELPSYDSFEPAPDDF
jgi:hypothetical protein